MYVYCFLCFVEETQGKKRKQYLHTFTSMSSKTRNHIVVVAIDFGYAYSFRSDFITHKTDHLNSIYTNKYNCGDLMSEKTPTTLYDKNRKVSFG